ncbi:MAG: MptD family putative ECF transporter S component [Eubacteriales bacterium]|nr:MptD family putative ECF transporter S component [Eubacteriales bacterium]
MNNVQERKLKVKDLILIGVFAIIYFIVLVAIGMMGMVPILFLIYPTILGIVAGTIVMLFEAKVPKPGALFIFGMLSPLIMFFMGHTYVLPLGALVIMLIAELIRKSGGYQSLKKDILACAVFNVWICFSLMQMLLMYDTYKAMTESMMPQGYFNALEKLISWPSMLLVILGALLGGYLGALIGKKLLKKHFAKAGIA